MFAASGFMPKSDPAPIQFMPHSMSKSNRTPILFNRPIFNRMQPSRMPRSSSLRLRCEAVKYYVVQSQNSDRTPNENASNYVIKFGSSFVESAGGMIEIANYICTLDRTLRSFESFEEKKYIIVLSAMGKTTNKLQLAGKKAISCEVSNVPNLKELTFIKNLHLRAADELGIDREIVSKHHFELEHLLKLIASMKEITPLTKDYLFSFGERMSASIFAAYLNKIGVKSKQYDSFEIGFITTDDLTNVNIIEATFPSDWINDPAIPINTSSLEKSMKPSKEGDKPVQVKISNNQKAPETEDNDINIVWDWNATILDITRMLRQFVRLFKVYMLMLLRRVERVIDDWLSTF